MDLLAVVRANLTRFAMVTRGARVVVGVSGGPDSVALLDLLFRLREEFGLKLIVAHLNHMLRGREADADAAFVERLAAGYGLPYVGERVDVAAYRAAAGGSPEEAAREVRYAFFARVAQDTAAARVALGHNADDQAETVLFHFLRGTGPAGLKGILPVRGIYIRPLITARRAAIAAYLAERGIAARLDRSNVQPVYTRNKIRLLLLPLLEKEYNPQIVDALGRLAEVCREEDAYLEAQGERALRDALLAHEEGRLRLRAAQVTDLPLALRRRVIRLAWQQVTGSEHPLDFGDVERVVRLLGDPAGGKQVPLPRRVRAEKAHGELVFTGQREESAVTAFERTLQVPGTTAIPELGLSIESSIESWDGQVDPRALPPTEAVLDADRVAFPLTVRTRRRGDRFAPLGGRGKVKLKRFLINAGVPRGTRDKLPLVVDAGSEIVWVAGVRPAETARVRDGTRQVLRLRLLRDE
ncbi:MAG: tRNA lysidine(34) synthetase TilS [Desulfotomaculales bacterium]